MLFLFEYSPHTPETPDTFSGVNDPFLTEKTLTSLFEPPPVQEDTDKDSGDEDEEGTISNLNRCQLQALATATVRRHGEKQSYDMEESADTPVRNLVLFYLGCGTCRYISLCQC
ncbi:hypothetical protein BaRGS_00000725 [Batillaria attramentaria]|uniref:Uncharacterized protein n=1 Tax=Batillaria attramentaria TaxID=370345 RepID=A0ABD0M7R6_9CAEN